MPALLPGGEWTRMRLITRYLLREFLGPLALCLVAFNGIFLVFDLFDNVSKFLEAGLPAFGILRYYGSLISAYSHWFVPASLMLATLYTMWHLSRNSEITAMRASGISFHRLAFPFLAVSVLLALVTAANIEFAVPEVSAWAQRLKDHGFQLSAAGRDVRVQHPYYNPPGRRMWVFAEVDAASPAGFARPERPVSVTQERPDGIREWTISTEEARFLDGHWWFSRPQLIRYDINGAELPLAEAPLGAPTLARMPELTETPRDMWAELRPWEMLSVRDMLRIIRQDPARDPAKRFDLQYRFAAPWACVVVTLLAIPGGLTTARQSVLRGLFAALAAFFGFYAMTHFGVFLGRQGLLPAGVAAWYPNVVCLLLGGWMYRRLT